MSKSMKAIIGFALFVTIGVGFLYWGSGLAYDEYLLVTKGEVKKGEVVSSEFFERKRGSRKRRRIERGYKVTVKELDRHRYSINSDSALRKACMGDTYDKTDLFLGAKGFKEAHLACGKVKDADREICCTKHFPVDILHSFEVRNDVAPKTVVKYWKYRKITDTENVFDFGVLWPPVVGIGLILVGFLNGARILPKGTFKLTGGDPINRWRVWKLTPAQWIALLGYFGALAGLAGGVVFNFEEALDMIFYDFTDRFPIILAWLLALGFVVTSLYGIWQARDGEMIRLARDVKKAKLVKELSDLQG